MASSPTRTMFYLVTTLLVLVFSALLLIGVLLLLRRSRRAKLLDDEDGLPEYEGKAGSRSFACRRLTITPAACSSRRSEPIFVYEEKQNLIANSSGPPPSTLPEIRITFPEEVDNAGKRQSGRVLVVRVGDHSVGLEPLMEELPPYQRHSSDRFQSLDLDRIGGLKEKI